MVNSVVLQTKTANLGRRVSGVDYGPDGFFNRVPKRSAHVLADLLMRVLDLLVSKMVSLAGSKGVHTITLDTFNAAAVMLPPTTMSSQNHKKWSALVSNAVSAAQREEQVCNTKVGQQEEDEEAGVLWTVNSYFAKHVTMLRPTTIKSFIRSKIGKTVRIGGGWSVVFAVTIFISGVLDAIFENVREQLDGVNSDKTESIAPSHIAKAIHSMPALESIIGNAVIVGVPVTHRPGVSRRLKRHRSRKSREGAAPASPSPSPSPTAAAPSPVFDLSEGSGSDVESPPAKKQRGPAPKRSSIHDILDVPVSQSAPKKSSIHDILDVPVSQTAPKTKFGRVGGSRRF